MDSRLTQDARMAKDKANRIEDGFWGRCVLAVMSTTPEPDIDEPNDVQMYQRGHKWRSSGELHL